MHPVAYCAFDPTHEVTGGVNANRCATCQGELIAGPPPGYEDDELAIAVDPTREPVSESRHITVPPAKATRKTTKAAKKSAPAADTPPEPAVIA